MPRKAKLGRVFERISTVAPALPDGAVEQLARTYSLDPEQLARTGRDLRMRAHIAEQGLRDANDPRPLAFLKAARKAGELWQELSLSQQIGLQGHFEKTRHGRRPVLDEPQLHEILPWLVEMDKTTTVWTDPAPRLTRGEPPHVRDAARELAGFWRNAKGGSPRPYWHEHRGERVVPMGADFVKTALKLFLDSDVTDVQLEDWIAGEKRSRTE